MAALQQCEQHQGMQHWAGQQLHCSTKHKGWPEMQGKTSSLHSTALGLAKANTAASMSRTNLL